MGSRYLIERELALTSRTQILLVHDNESGEKRIFKRLREMHPHPLELARLRQEAAMLEQLSSPYVIRTFGYDRLEDSYGVWLQAYGEMNLAEMKQRRVSLGLIPQLKLIMQIAQGLQAIHEKKIMHCDLNPRNILVDASLSKVKIIDFSIAAWVEGEQGTASYTSFEGSLPYMAPEQTGRMNREVDTRVDLYALGVTAFELLTGQLPFLAQDLLGYMHAHLAKRPPTPSQLRKELGPMLDAFLLKLLEKNPETRYQTAEGVVYDLQKIIERAEHGRLNDLFALGEADQTEQFAVPSSLYGREKERSVLLEAFERSRNQFTLVTVAGYSGVGKTSLVRELDRPILARRGFFISGKFDQYARSRGLGAILEALEELVGQVLLRPEEELQRFRLALRRNLGASVAVLTECLPSFGDIIRAEHQLTPLPPAEASRRLLRAIQGCFRSFVENGLPLTLFLDDLQWADQATLELLRELAFQDNIQGLFILGSYRDNEVSPSHPLRFLLDDCAKRGVLGTLELKPLPYSATLELIADTLRRQVDQIEDLTRWIYQQSEGNPFFTLEILKDLRKQKILTFDRQKRQWGWQAEALLQAKAADDVTEFLTKRLSTLSPPTLDDLKVASCVGFHFDLGRIARYHNVSSSEILKQLQHAVGQQLIVCTNFDLDLLLSTQDEQLISQAAFRFRHDRIQQAAHQLLKDEDRIQIFHRLAKQLLSKPGRTQGEELELAEYFFEASRLVRHPQELRAMLESFLAAAKIARASNAYENAYRLLKKARECMPQEYWSQEKSLAVDISLTLFENNFLTNRFAQNDKLGKELVTHVRGTDAELQLLYNLCLQYSVEARTEECYAVGRQLLALCGVMTPEEPKAYHSAINCIKIKMALRKRPLQQFETLAEVDSYRQRIVLKVLFEMTAVATNSGHRMRVGFAVTKATELALSYGVCPETAYAFAGFATVATFFLNDPDLGKAFAETSLKILERLKNQSLKGRILGCYANFSHNWYFSNRNYADILRRALDAAYEEGDLLWIAAIGISITNGTRSLNLSESIAMMRKYMTLVETTGQVDFIQFGRCTLGYFYNVSGLTNDAMSFSYKDFDEAEATRLLQEKGSAIGLIYLWVNKAEVALCLQKYAEAGRYLRQLVPHVDGMTSLVVTFDYQLMWTLFEVRALREGDPSLTFGSVQKRVKQRLQFARRWAKRNPGNFRYYQLFQEAELCFLQGKWLEAQKLYEQLLSEARTLQQFRYEALAQQFIFLALKDMDLKLAAMSMGRDCIQTLKLWGAKTRIDYLQRQFPELPREEYVSKVRLDQQTWQASQHTLRHAPSSGATAPQADSLIDIPTLLKASQAVMGEVTVEGLMRTLSSALLEYAGATRVALILGPDAKDSSKLVMLREAEDSAPELPRLELDQVDQLPIVLIRKVMRSKRLLLIADSQTAIEAREDAYARKLQPSSILCVPMLAQGELKGVLYLENSLALNAFSQDRSQMLEVLASHAAIALEHALLYQNLEQRVFEKTRDLRSILTHVKLGIFALKGPELCIDELYSPYLEVLFGSKDLVGKPALPFLMGRALSFDKDQEALLLASLQAIVGEGSLAFAMNHDHLPRELRLAVGDGVRELEIDWAPMLDQHDQVEKILVCLRDVTDIRSWQNDAGQKQDELQRLSELMEHSPARVQKFLHEFELWPFTEANVQGDQFIALGRRLHTLKGVARSMGFLSLSEALHYAEDYVMGGEREDDGELVRALGQVKSAAAVYLGLALKLWQHQGEDELLTLRAFLEPLATRVMRESASALNKLQPHVYIEAPPLTVGDAGRGLLEKVLVHILRNAVDHGIESLEERLQAHKSPEGVVGLKAEVVAESLLLYIEDDGRGLALDRIRVKGQARGLWSDDVGFDQTAQSIFMSGLSTRDTVSEISGRGIGLDAVADLLSEVGGTIRVEFREQPVWALTRFRFVLTIPLAVLEETETYQRVG